MPFLFQDALLASIAETEKLTELAARVSSWKQKIEHNLDEQVILFFSFLSLSNPTNIDQLSPLVLS